MNVCLIPARGGSKRIPRKNIRPFFGRPALWYAVDLAERSGLFDGIYVTTEDRDIGHLAMSYGAAWHHRSEGAASDSATDYEVLQEFCRSTQADYICYLYPVTPLLDVMPLRQGYSMVLTGFWDIVYGVDLKGVDAGAFYWVSVAALRDMTEGRYYEKQDYGPVELGQFQCHDVNTEDDWKVLAAKYAVKGVMG